MKAKEIKDLTLEEVQDKLAETSADLAKLKINHSISNVENPMLISQKRKSIARLKTELRMRAIKATNK
jgi:large subunit ribosomal protein L29